MGKLKNFDSSPGLLAELRTTLWKRRLLFSVAGLMLSMAALVSLSILYSALANLIILPVSVKITLLLTAVLGLGYLFVRFVIRPFTKGSIEAIAVNLEEKNDNLKGRMVAAVQFAQEAARKGFSRDLIRLNEQQALAEAGRINFNEVIRFYPLWKTGRFLIGSLALSLIALLLLPGFFSYSYEVFSNPTEEIAPPLAYNISAEPGSTEWVKYRDLTIGGSIFGFRLPEKATLHYRLADGNWQETKFKLEQLPHHAIAAGDSISFGLTLRQINRSLDYWIEAGRLKTELYAIDVVDRPRVAAIELNLFYPKYTGLSPETIDENNGSFSAVVGTRASIRIKTNLPIETADLLFADSSQQPMKLDDRGAQTTLLVESSKAYQFELTDHLGEKNPDPIEYFITAVPDEYPSIDVLYPGFNVNLTEDLSLPFKLHIYDDFGFSSLVLKYRLVTQGRQTDETVAVLHYSEDITTEGDIEFNWDVSRFDIYPGDYIIYHFEIADNDLISGPKVTSTRQYLARLPSLEEIIAQTEKESVERITATEQLLKTGHDLSKRLEEAMRKIEAESQQPKNSDWQQKKELESIANKNMEMMAESERLSKNMSESLEKMRENSLMSRQIMERLEQIQKLFEDVATPEMREAQRKLAEAMRQMDPQKLKEALENFQMTQEELLSRLERTLALLKRLQVEQKMEAMIRQAEQLLEQQAKVNEETESSEPESLPELSKAEKKNQASMEDLKSQVDELDNMLAEAKMDQSEEAKKFAEAVRQTDADQNMRKMADNLNQQDKKSSMSEGQESESKLAKMLDQMHEQLSSLQGGDMEKMMAAMRRSIRDANYLSQDQETALNRTGQISPKSSVYHDLALDQQDIQAASEGLHKTIQELSQQSPFIAAELSLLVSQAAAAMNSAMTELESKRSSAAQAHQRNAMSKLNKVSLRLMESLDEQSQCQNPDQSQPMNKLESICDKQNKLNQKTQKQCNNPSLSPSGKPGQMTGMERLAGEQAGIRKSLQELEKEFGNSRQIMGRLDDIAREMKKVEEELASGQAGEETMQRQLRIFSRMLEATRSLQRKDYNEQRQAQSAESNTFYAPPGLTSDLLNDPTGLEERLRKYLGDDYPPQYEAQIKAYFRALLQLQFKLREQK